MGVFIAIPGDWFPPIPGGMTGEVVLSGDPMAIHLFRYLTMDWRE